MTSFSITNIVNQIGESITVTHITARTLDDRGHSTDTTASLTVQAIVEIMDGSEDLVKEGHLRGGDLIMWADENATNASTVVTGDTISYKSKNYNVKNVIVNKGHYEFWAERI